MASSAAEPVDLREQLEAVGKIDHDHVFFLESGEPMRSALPVRPNEESRDYRQLGSNEGTLLAIDDLAVDLSVAFEPPHGGIKTPLLLGDAQVLQLYGNQGVSRPAIRVSRAVYRAVTSASAHEIRRGRKGAHHTRFAAPKAG